jgi:hypothetical protein
MKIAQVLMPLTLSLGLIACSEKSDFKGESKPQEEVKEEVKVEEADLPSAETSVDTSDAMGSKPSTDADTGDSRNLPLGAISDQHAVSLKVDLVFAVDTSASMDDEIRAMQTNLGRLVSGLNSGRLDAQIHVMMDQLLALPAGVDAKKIAFVNQEVGSENAISRLNALFAGMYVTFYLSADGVVMPMPLAFRKDAKLEVVVISDDDGDGNGNLAADFNPLNAKATFNAIVGLPSTMEGGNCDISGIGMEYITLAQASRGSMLDICSPDWSGLITRLTDDMVKRSVTFSLSKTPADAKAIVVTLDGKRLAASDWTYDATNNTVSLVKTDGVKDGSKISLNYKPTAS